MPTNYITQISKDGGAPFQMMDKEARELISTLATSLGESIEEVAQTLNDKAVVGYGIVNESNKSTVCQGSCDHLPNNGIFAVGAGADLTNEPFDSVFYQVMTFDRLGSASGDNHNGTLQVALLADTQEIRIRNYRWDGTWSSWLPIDYKADDLEQAVGKELAVANYSIQDGIMSIQGTVDTSQSFYKRLEYQVNGDKILLVAGYNYGANYVGWMALDANNKVITKIDGFAYDASFTMCILVPPGTVKVVVNVRENNSSYICNYVTKQDTVSPEIKTSLENIGGKLVFGYAWKYDGSEQSGNYAYLVAPVSEGEYYITGKNMGKNYPLFTLLDANDNPIYLMGEATEFNALDYKVILPAGAKTMIVNSIRSILPAIKKYVPSTTENLSTLIDEDTRDKKMNLVSLNPTVTYGSVMNKDTSLAEDETYMHCEQTVTGGKTYYVTGRNFSYNYPMILCLNSSGDVCYSSGFTFESNSMHFDYKIRTPLDAVKLVVNSITGADIDIKVSGENSLYKTMSDGMLTGVYLGKTPTKEIEYTYTNGSWVYDSAKAERNLSKFGYAYAIMLERIMKTYPGATVICCTQNEAERITEETGFPERNKIGETIADYNRVIVTLAEAFGAMVVDHHSCGITYFNLEDYMYDYASATGFGLHPNAAGMALIAQKTVKDLSGIDWTGKKVSVYGDSISTYNGTGSTYNQYPAGDVTSVDKTWWYKSLITELGMTLLTNGSGGGRSVSTIREGHVSGRPKSGCNQDAIDALAVDDVTPDVIIIKQGINDFGNVGMASNLNLNGHYYFGGL